MARLTRGLLRSGFQTKILYAFFVVNRPHNNTSVVLSNTISTTCYLSSSSGYRGWRQPKRKADNTPRPSVEINSCSLRQHGALLASCFRRISLNVTETAVQTRRLINPLKMKLIWIIFYNPLRTSKKTQRIYITKINWLMFKEIISVYSENHTKPINSTLWVKRSYLMLEQVVHVVTTRL
jgi:hypothetical protein